MDWDDLKYFLEIARKGSIRAAAKALAVNHSTVSRRINNFEEKIGVRLFERLPTGYVLTTAGQDMMASAQRVDDEIAGLDRQILGRDTQPTGKLIVTVPEMLATTFLMPDIKKFTDTYPGIDLEFVVSNEQLSLTKREADVAIRLIDHSPPEHLIGRNIITYVSAIYASRSYLKTKYRENDFSSLQWIGWREAEQSPQWIQDSVYPTVPIRHQTDDLAFQLSAAKAGLGISILPCFVGDVDPDLQRLPLNELRKSRDIWILTHKDLRYTTRVTIFMEYMTQAIRAKRDLLEGRCGQ